MGFLYTWYVTKTIIKQTKNFIKVLFIHQLMH